MEKKRNIFCAWVNGNAEDLTRPILTQAFSKYGNVKKIFINTDFAFAKVYLDDPDGLRLACTQLNGFKSWEIRHYRDNYNKPGNESFERRSTKPLETSLSPSASVDNISVASNGNPDEMEADCTPVADYVDVHGRPVEVLQGENGQLYVNLDDVRTGGFNIYKKAAYDNAVISRDVDLQHLEIFLLNQAKKYVLDMKQTFNEDEMLNVFERVQAKLKSRNSVGPFGEGRVVQCSPTTKNFSITTSNVLSNAASSSRPPNTLAENFQPTFSHMKAKPKREFGTENWQNRQNGLTPATNGFNRSPQGFENKTERKEENRRYSDNRIGFVEASGSGGPRPHNTRRPNLSSDGSKDILSKAVANASADEEPEESWEGAKSVIPKSKPQVDSSSVNNERKLNIDRVVLTPGSCHKVKVSFVKPSKKSLFYAQPSENQNQIEEILLHVNSVDLKLPEIATPAREMLCVVEYEDCWYRAVVLHYNLEKGAFVELIDYGNQEHIKTPIREMSTEMKKIPGMAIRMAIHQPSDGENGNLDIKTDQDLEVFVKKHISDEYDDVTHLVEIKRVLDEPKLDDEFSTPPSEVNSDPEPPKAPKPTKPAEECYTQIPPSTAKLLNGESVQIVGYINDRFILRNKEAAVTCRSIYAHLNEMHEKKPISEPKVGQLVLCSRDGTDGVHRAVIRKIENQVAELEYLDYDGRERLTLKSLRNVDQTLATYPSAKIESPVFQRLLNIGEKSESLINTLIVNKTKLKVILDGPKFDLQLVEGDKTILLSRKIEQLENPAPPKREEAPVVQPPPAVQPPRASPAVVTSKASSNNAEFVKMTFDDVDFAKPELGEDEYICYSCTGDSITLLSTSTAGKYLEEIEIDEPADSVPHTPELFEMCLAKFQNVWYRATVTEIDNDTNEVLFVDYGNTENIPKSDFRKYPKKFADIPILGINAYFMDVPDNVKVKNRLKELIPDESVLTVNVKTDLNEELKHGIIIPTIYATLKTEKLI